MKVKYYVLALALYLYACIGKTCAYIDPRADVGRGTRTTSISISIL